MGRVSEWLQEVQDILNMTLFNKWLWIIIAGMASIVIFPFLIMMVLLSTEWWIATVITALIIVGWGIAGGYKDYLLHKHKQEQAKLHGEDNVPFTYAGASDKDKEYD